MKITYEKCPCGQAGCQTYMLVGIGDFYEGSGFTEEEARRICEALNSRGLVQEISEERTRQIYEEGWAPLHDDKYTHGELARASAAYALHSAKFRFAKEHGVHYQTRVTHPEWPWHPSWWKPKDPRRDLIRAAALIQAEILRLDRAAILGVLSEPMDLWTVASRLGRDKTSLSFKSLAGAMDTLLSDGKVLWDSSTNIYRRAENA